MLMQQQHVNEFKKRLRQKLGQVQSEFASLQAPL